jgi:hypothetical protein
MNVIDLDRPAASAVAPRRPHQRFAVVALVVGVLLGAAGTYVWDMRRQSAARDGEVSVFVLADAGRALDGGSVLRGGRVSSVTLLWRITLINAGPAPVNVRNLAVDRPGVTVRGVEKQRWLAPGETVQADADVQVDCARGLPLGRLPVTLSVQTSDERIRQAQPKDALDGSPWTERTQSACAGAV